MLDMMGHAIRAGLLNGGVHFNMIDNRHGNYVGGNAPQTQMNTGHHATQTGAWGVEQNSKFDELIAAISSHPELEPEDKQDAVETLNDLKAKKEAGTLRSSFFQKMWESLPQVVRTITVAGEVFAILHGA